MSKVAFDDCFLNFSPANDFVQVENHERRRGQVGHDFTNVFTVIWLEKVFDSFVGN